MFQLPLLDAERADLVLDSLDETAVADEKWHGVIDRNPLTQRCRVIMTSRPTPLAHRHADIFGARRTVNVFELVPMPPADCDGAG